MSIRFPDYNASLTGNNGFLINIPSGVTNKPANTPSVSLMWIRTRDISYDTLGVNYNLLSRNGGSTTSPDGSLVIAPDMVSIQYRIQSSGSTIGVTPWSAGALEFGQRYLVMATCRNGWMHAIACKPGGTPQVGSVANTAVYALNMSGAGAHWVGIGGGYSSASRANMIPVEDFNFYIGAFPETADGVPDAALIQAIANGTQDLNTLHTLLVQEGASPPAHACRYPMLHHTDFAATVGAVGDLTLTTPAGAAAAGAKMLTGGPVAPGRLLPAPTGDRVSQVAFGTPGDAATAFARIRVEGGSYSGLPAMHKMQVRLIDEDRNQVADWIDLTTTAPSGGAGTWAESDGFPAVLMRASYLTRHFRAVDSGGTTLAETYGFGLSGAGFSCVTIAQSQLAFLFTNHSGGAGALALTPGVRAIVIRQDTFVKPTQAAMLYSSNTNTRAAARGIRQMINEINARFPGVPIQADTTCQAGAEIDWMFPASALNSVDPSRGIHAARPTYLRTFYGIHQPFYMIYMGHSGSSSANYHDFIAENVAWYRQELGTPIKELQVPVPRKSLIATNEDAGGGVQYRNSRRGSRKYAMDNPASALFMGSWSSVQSDDEVSGSGHPSNTNLGQGRSGGLLGWALMSACRAVPDVPVQIKGWRQVGADMVIEFGAVNP